MRARGRLRLHGQLELFLMVLLSCFKPAFWPSDPVNFGAKSANVNRAQRAARMTKPGWRRVALWDLALVGGPLAIAEILALNRWSWGNLRPALLAIYGAELVLIVASAWQDVLTTRGRSYADVNAPATRDVLAIPDPTDFQDIRRRRRTRQDPIAIGPGIAVVLFLLSFVIAH